MITLQQVNPEDVGTITTALSWIDSAPRWFRDCDAVWGRDTPATYAAKLAQQVDWGVFVDESLHSIISLTLAGKGVYNVHLMAQRRADPEPLIIAGRSMRQQLFIFGAREIWCWLAQMNRGVQKIAQAIGFVKDGVQMFKGQTHGRVILWERFSCRV